MTSENEPRPIATRTLTRADGAEVLAALFAPAAVDEETFECRFEITGLSEAEPLLEARVLGADSIHALVSALELMGRALRRRGGDGLRFLDFPPDHGLPSARAETAS